MKLAGLKQNRMQSSTPTDRTQLIILLQGFGNFRAELVHGLLGPLARNSRLKTQAALSGDVLC